MLIRPLELKLDFCFSLDASHDRGEVLPAVDNRGNHRAFCHQPVDDAVAMDQTLTNRWVINLRNDTTELRILGNGFGCLDDLGYDGGRIPWGIALDVCSYRSTSSIASGDQTTA